MRSLWLVFILFPLMSCFSNSTGYKTVDITFSCTPIVFFDTLETVLFTNDMSDLGGKKQSIILRLFINDEKKYLKKVPKKNGHFFIDSVKANEYVVLMIEGKIGQDLFWGYLNNINLSNKVNDTITYNICMSPTNGTLK